MHTFLFFYLVTEYLHQGPATVSLPDSNGPDICSTVTLCTLVFNISYIHKNINTNIRWTAISIKQKVQYLSISDILPSSESNQIKSNLML